MEKKPNRIMSDKMQDVVHLVSTAKFCLDAAKCAMNVLDRRIDEIVLSDARKRKEDG